MYIYSNYNSEHNLLSYCIYASTKSAKAAILNHWGKGGGGAGWEVLYDIIIIMIYYACNMSNKS